MDSARQAPLSMGFFRQEYWSGLPFSSPGNPTQLVCSYKQGKFGHKHTAMWGLELRRHKSMNTRGWKRGREQILPIFVQTVLKPWSWTAVLQTVKWYTSVASVSSVQFSHSVLSNSLRPHESQHARPPCPSPTPGVHSLTSIESVTPSSHHPLLLLPPIPPSIRVFSNESTLRMRWPKYWSFGFSIIASKEHPGLISFRMDWLDLLAVQGTLKSLLQHHSSKASIFQCSAFFTVQFSHPYMTTGKTIALTNPLHLWHLVLAALAHCYSN